MPVGSCSSVVLTSACSELLLIFTVPKRESPAKRRGLGSGQHDSNCSRYMRTKTAMGTGSWVETSEHSYALYKQLFSKDMHQSYNLDHYSPINCLQLWFGCVTWQDGFTSVTGKQGLTTDPPLLPSFSAD